MLLNVLKSLPVPLLFNLVWSFLSLKDANTPWWNLRTSLDCIVPRHLLPCCVITCWVLRKKQVCSCDGSDPHAFQDSAGCCGVNVTCAGDTAGGQAFVLCLCALSICFSLLSLWTGMLWRSTCLNVVHLCCSVSWGPAAVPVNTLNISVLLPSSQAAADFQLQVSSALGFSQMRFLNQVSSS